MSAEPSQKLTKKDLEELLQSKVESFTSSPLTALGENFGSILLKVGATLVPGHRKMSMVAKLVVTKNLMGGRAPFRDFVRKEIDMYLRLRPEILAVQEEHKVPREYFLDVIPRCYGARTTRGGDLDQPVDETALILMENLNVSGYHVVDRIVGMDLKHAECVVTHLARFQATFVVFKLKKPDFFKNTVMRSTAEIKHEPPPKPSFDPDAMLMTLLNTTLASVPSVVEHADRIKKAITNAKDFLRNKGYRGHKAAREPFATLVHNDFWTNNVMFKHGENNDENIKGLKLIDFQMTTYGSPATDLLSFLYNSTSLDVTKDDRDRLIRLYHQEFRKWLELFGCDSRPFSYEIFRKEIEYVAPVQFDRVFFQLRIFCMSKSNPPDINNPSAFVKMQTDNTGLGEIYFKKVDRLVREFVERKWI